MSHLFSSISVACVLGSLNQEFILLPIFWSVLHIFSFSSFIVSGIQFKALIHTKLLFVHDETLDLISFFYIHRSSFASTVYWRDYWCSTVWSKHCDQKQVGCYVCILISSLSILFHWSLVFVSIFMPVPWCLVIVAVDYALLSDIVMPPAWPFLMRIFGYSGSVMILYDCWDCLLNFNIMRNVIVVLLGSVLNPYFSLGYIDTLITLILLIHGQALSFLFLMPWFISLFENFHSKELSHVCLNLFLNVCGFFGGYYNICFFIFCNFMIIM